MMGMPLAEFHVLALFAIDFLSCACSLPSFPFIKMADLRKGLKKFTYDDCDAEPKESSLNEEENDVPSDTGESE